MGIDVAKLREFSIASFALWPLDIESDAHQLHARTVILGLNPSEKISFGENFHGKRFDRWYEDAFSEEPFRGCYMTDLISYPEADSKVVLAKWKDSAFREACIAELQKQFLILKVTEKTPILCIGKVTKESFSEVLPEFQNVYHVKHPNSYRMTGKRDVFLNDMKHTGSEIEKLDL